MTCVGDRRAVHDRADLGHVEVVGGALAPCASCVLDADVDDEGARRHQVAGGDQLADPDLVGDVGEDLAQAACWSPRFGVAVTP